MADVIELARRHDDAFNSQDADGRAAIEAPDMEFVMPGGMTLRGHEQVVQAVRAFWDALPDATITAVDQVAVGNVVVAEGTIAGTHNGMFQTPQGEIPRTGNPVSVRYAAVKRFEGDRLVSEHLYFDQLELLQQLGAMK
jgi:ketosteroid isomerase-like protein